MAETDTDKPNRRIELPRSGLGFPEAVADAPVTPAWAALILSGGYAVHKRQTPANEPLNVGQIQLTKNATHNAVLDEFADALEATNSIWDDVSEPVRRTR